MPTARLLAQDTIPRYGVLNQGVSGNRVAADGYPGDGVATAAFGVSALNRLERDVFAQTSVRTAVVRASTTCSQALRPRK